MGTEVSVVVIVHRAEEGGYWAEFAGLEGCFVQGETLDGLLEEARSAVPAHIEALRAEGRPIPPFEDVVVATVTIEARPPDLNRMPRIA